MKAIDITKLKPHKVSNQLGGKSFFFYGPYKSGKTTVASKFPKPIILGFEKGWSMIDGVIGQPINKWSEALTVKRQLLNLREQYEAGEIDDPMFETVVVDTADIAYDQCEEYILAKEGVSYVDETHNMRGYKATQKEYDKYLQEIAKAGYALVVISHSQLMQRKNKQTGEKWEQIAPTVDKRGMAVISRFADVIGYVAPETDEEGNTQMMLTMRGNSDEVVSGTRGHYMSARIPFSFEALRDDVKQAMDKEIAASRGKDADKTTEPENLFKDQTDRGSFSELIEAIKAYAAAFGRANHTADYKAVTNRYLGMNRLVMDCNESQTDILQMIRNELEDQAAKLGILAEKKTDASEKEIQKSKAK